MWVSQVLSAFSLVRDLSWSFACPVYCGGSQVPFLFLGFGSGLVCGFLLVFCALRAVASSLILASNSLWTCRLAHFDGLTDLVTCMSDRVSSQDISELTSAIRDLTLAINPPEPDPETSSLGDWELLGEESEDIAVSRDAGCLEVRFRTLEEGPGPTPLYCVDLANRKLSGKPPGPSARCRRAFVAGFFANKAVQCQTGYIPENPLPGFKIVHWVVLRCPPVFSEPVRFTNRVDFGRALEASSGDLVVEPFASFTEVEIFCIGAGIRIPRLGVWRSQPSDAFRMGSQASSSGQPRMN